MKTSNSGLCAIVAFVLGLSATVSAPHAFALEQDYKIYPGDTCVKLAGAANITRNEWGGIANRHPTANLFVSCPVLNVVDDYRWRIGGAWIDATDRNPGPTIAHEIICNLIQVRRINSNSGVLFRITGGHTNGASNNLQFISVASPDPGNTLGSFSTNYFKCLIPPQTSDGAFSELHAYGVIERPFPGGMLQVMLPPHGQEMEARAAVEALKMGVEQALNAEKEDPEWSQRAETSWTQVFQQQTTKEELKGIRLRSIECRTSICRVELTPTDLAQGAGPFEQGIGKFMLLAPWQGSGFGKIENSGGQAPVATFYMAREGHTLPETGSGLF